jgi:hypothetical protein
MVKLAAVCAALFSCLALTPASASAAMSDPAFTVHLLSANGSGCPPGSAAVSQASTSEFTITYSDYIAYAGGGASPTEFRKNCQLDVGVGVPSGWTYGIFEVDYRGFAYMDKDARGSLSASYYFAGLAKTYQQLHPLFGPQSGDYEFTDQAKVVGWAPCHFNATLNVNTDVRVFAGSSKTFVNELTMDSSDVSLSTIYHLGFKRC